MRDEVRFLDWEISRLNFDAVKKRVDLTASRNNWNESYTYIEEVEFIYGLETFLTNLHKMSKNYNPDNNKELIKEFLISNNLIV